MTPKQQAEFNKYLNELVDRDLTFLTEIVRRKTKRSRSKNKMVAKKKAPQFK